MGLRAGYGGCKRGRFLPRPDSRVLRTTPTSDHGSHHYVFFPSYGSPQNSSCLPPARILGPTLRAHWLLLRETTRTATSVFASRTPCLRSRADNPPPTRETRSYTRLCRTSAACNVYRDGHSDIEPCAAHERFRRVHVRCRVVGTFSRGSVCRFTPGRIVFRSSERVRIPTTDGRNGTETDSA